MKSAILARPDTTRAPKPALATAAPAKPPIKACEELDGIPKYQVMRFHVMAPMSPPRITH